MSATESVGNELTAAPNKASAFDTKNIVLISGNRIAPAETGGAIHSLSIARALARIGHTVRIFSVAGRREDYRLANFLRRNTLHNVIEHRLSEETNVGILFGMLQTVARRLDYPRIWQYELLARGIVPTALLHALQQADIVLSDLPYCPPIPGPWRGKPWFLVSHNLEHKLLEQSSARQRRFSNWMHKVESAAPGAYTDIFACSEEDQAFFRANDPKSRLALPMIRCGVDPKDYAFAPQTRERMRATLGFDDDDWVFVFSGSGYRPNIAAFEEIKIFCREAADFLKQARVYFLVVGSVSSSAYRDGALLVTGRIARVLPYLAAADAGINLVVRGSGSNVKMFEYLAAKLPVISTIFGARGTPLRIFDDYLPCSSVDLKQTIERFISVERPVWRRRADAVWERHRRSCDIQELVADAVALLPAFAARVE